LDTLKQQSQAALLLGLGYNPPSLLPAQPSTNQTKPNNLTNPTSSQNEDQTKPVEPTALHNFKATSSMDNSRNRITTPYVKPA